MSNANVIEFKKHKGFLSLVFNNEKQRNCLSPQMMTLFKNIIEKELCNECRFVLIQAKGVHFCAGADLEWMKNQKEKTLLENYKDSVQLQDFFEAIYKIPVPVIAYVQGASYGGGVGVVAACDYIIAEPKASFCLSEVKLGLVPAVISPFVINKIGISWFSALSTSAKVINADNAKAISLIHEIADENLLKLDIDGRAKAISKNFLALSPSALVENKKIVRSYTNQFVLDKNAQYFNRATITKLRAGLEGIEGMSALLEKRAPNWTLEG